MTRGCSRSMSESALHKSVAQYLRLSLMPPTIWTTFPAGGGGKVRGAQLKAMGLAPGFPDILILHPGDPYTFVLGLELKSAKGRQSPEQKAMAVSFRTVGGHYAVCRSIDEVVAELRAIGIPLRARAA